MVDSLLFPLQNNPFSTELQNLLQNGVGSFFWGGNFDNRLSRQARNIQINAALAVGFNAGSADGGDMNLEELLGQLELDWLKKRLKTLQEQRNSEWYHPLAGLIPLAEDAGQLN